MVTATLGTTAPVVSTTVPSTDPVVLVWAILAVTKTIETMANTASINNLRFFIFQIFPCLKGYVIVSLQTAAGKLHTFAGNEATAMPLEYLSVIVVRKDVKVKRTNGKTVKFPYL